MIFTENNWKFRDESGFENVEFKKDKFSFEINSSEAQYIESVFFPVEKPIIEMDLFLNAQEAKISIYFIELEGKKRRYVKRYRLHNGENKFIHALNTDSFLQILIRIETPKKDKVELELKKFEFKDNIPNELIEYVKNLPFLDKSLYLLTPASFTNSYHFKPRRDLEEFEINLPLDWDINPFHDNNWQFQLNALRLLDTELDKYFKTNDEKLLQRAIEVMLDWKRDLLEKRKFDFERKNIALFTWQDMATGLRAMKIALVFEMVIKNHYEKFKNFLPELLYLLILHIEALTKQEIGSGNHGIFQIHGLMLLLRLFPDDINKTEIWKRYAKRKMREKFFQQFFLDGIHSENSAAYHYLGVEVFEKILNKELYSGLKVVLEVLDKAKKNTAYMHFPNLEILTTGDTDYKIVKKRAEEEIKEGLTYFKESGYVYIYEKDSFFYLKSAFLNKGHAHADFFNILWYEFDKNILVDAGKYSYDKNNPFRKYCLSTRAHNTLLIDNRDFRVDRKFYFNAELEYQNLGFYHLRVKNYYRYFYTTHQRDIFYLPKKFLIVVDSAYGKKSQDLKQIFHFHQDLELEKKELVEVDVNGHILKIDSLSVDKSGEIQKNINFYKGLDGEIEGFRALEHNKIVDNFVYYNQTFAKDARLVSAFMFEKVDFSVDYEKIILNGKKILFEVENG